MIVVCAALAQGSVNPSNNPAVLGVGSSSVSSLSASSSSEELRVDLASRSSIVAVLISRACRNDPVGEGGAEEEWVGRAGRGQEDRRGGVVIGLVEGE